MSQENQTQRAIEALTTITDRLKYYRTVILMQRIQLLVLWIAVIALVVNMEAAP